MSGEILSKPLTDNTIMRTLINILYIIVPNVCLLALFTPILPILYIVPIQCMYLCKFMGVECM